MTVNNLFDRHIRVHPVSSQTDIKKWDSRFLLGLWSHVVPGKIVKSAADIKINDFAKE